MLPMGGSVCALAWRAGIARARGSTRESMEFCGWGRQPLIWDAAGLASVDGLAPTDFDRLQRSTACGLAPTDFNRPRRSTACGWARRAFDRLRRSTYSFFAVCKE
ncbi:hypothetical protein, partial [Tahibacter sp.]|uniref:hypothetical protein n=1 Tax=Tahibacter sp. TaxID=2056211 RepID=UPI0028C473D0